MRRGKSRRPANGRLRSNRREPRRPKRSETKLERWTLNKSYLIAAGFTLGLAAWVAGGYVFKSSGKETPDAPAVADAVAPMTVSVRTQDAKLVEQYIVAPVSYTHLTLPTILRV